MRLISLEITNFRVIKQARLNFPDKVIGIIGRNGSGKSSIIEAISWALYGNQAARTGRDEIKASYAGASENCEVALEFSVNDEQYRVVRRLVGRNQQAEAQLWRGDAPESVGVNETNRYTAELLGLDWRGFLSSFLARQQELNALSDLQPSKRRDHIAGMLGIERLDKAIGRVKDDSRLSAARVDVLDRQLSDRQLVERSVAELTDKLGVLRAPLDRLEQVFKDVQKKFTELTEAYRQAQQKEARWRESRVRIEAESKSLAAQQARLETLRKESADLDQARSERDSLTEPLQRLPVVRKELDELNRRKAEAALREELNGQRERLNREAGTISTKLAESDKQRREIADELGGIPDDIDDQVEATREQLEQAREEYSHLSAEIKSKERERAKLEDQISSIAEFGPESVCDRCLRPLGDDLESIRQHFGQELDQLRGDIADLSAGQARLKESGAESKRRFEKSQQQSQAAYKLKLKIKGLDESDADLKGRAEDCRRRLKQVEDQLSKIPSESFDPAAMAKLTDELATLDSKQQRYNQLEGSLVRQPQVIREIDECGARIEEIRAAVSSLHDELAELRFDEKEYAELGAAFAEGQKQVEVEREEFLRATREKELAEKELDEKLKRLKGFDKTAAELEEHRSAHYYGEKLSGLLAEYRKDLIASIRPSLAEISSRLIAEMTDDQYSLVDLDEKYNLRVMDSGEYFGVERFSGGEKDLANLCLRMAISLALTESAGLQRSFVILDEVFGSQDVQRKELILKALANLKSRFPQILLVTHVEDIKDGVEELIMVESTGAGWSEVKVDGEKI